MRQRRGERRSDQAAARRRQVQDLTAELAEAHGRQEIVAGNGLPSLSGTFPIASDDPAYSYDRNPNSIKSYTLKVKLPGNPKRASKPTCVGGTIGVSTTGIPIFSAFDAGGRDAPAHEVQDSCTGHPQVTGQYHYHAISACWKDRGPKNGPSSLFGYALDGFGIYGSRDEHGKTLSSADLDPAWASAGAGAVGARPPARRRTADRLRAAARRPARQGSRRQTAR